MELLMGNLLVLLVTFGLIGFALLWIKFYDGAFREVFSFYRKRNLRYEWTVVGCLIGLVSVVVIGLYYGMHILCDYKPLPWYSVLFVVMVLLLVYLGLQATSINNSVIFALALSMLVFILPFALSLLVLYQKVLLDQYCLGVTVICLLLNSISFIRLIPHWKKGDM